MGTVYIKLLAGDGAATAVEELHNPRFVRQISAGKVFACEEPQAHGVLDASGQHIYQIKGRATVERAVATAQVITQAEYLELLATLGSAEDEDPEDTAPETGGADEEPMTRAELTAAVDKLAEDQEALVAAIERGLSL